MNNKERAKQFIPFDAMKGLTEALRVREERRSRVERKQLSKDMAARISRALSRIEAGTSVRIVFFCDGHYIDIEGRVSEKDTVYRYLKIGNEKIHFDDIYKLKIL